MSGIRELVRSCICAAVVTVSMAADAFMPAAGVWTIDSEENGKPGRGFQLDVENGVAIFYYNGYRSDGSSVFYMAFGPINNSVFVAPLREYRGGTVMGGVRRDAVDAGSPGNVSIAFSSGMRGQITFPGEQAKSISKFNYGHGKDADGLLGTYLMAFSTGTSVIGDKFSLTRKLGSTSMGNGVAASADGRYACENMTSSELAGMVMCVEINGTTGQLSTDNSYLFRMSGNRGTGVGTWSTAIRDYPLEVWRTATRTGESTGLNEGTYASLERLKGDPAPQADAQEAARMHVQALKNIARETGGEQLLNAEERDLLHKWMGEAGQLLRVSP